MGILGTSFGVLSFLAFTIIPLIILIIIIYGVWISYILYPVCGTDITCYTDTLSTICENDNSCYYNKTKLNNYVTQYKALNEILDTNVSLQDELKNNPYLTIAGFIPGYKIITMGGKSIEGNVKDLDSYKTNNPNAVSKTLAQATKIQEYIDTITKNSEIIKGNTDYAKQTALIVKNLQMINDNNNTIINYLK